MAINIQSKMIRSTLGLISIIIIGAIYCGLWEELILPVFDLLAEFTINLFSYYFFSFENSLYKSIAKGYTEESSFLAVILILFIYAIYLVYYISNLFPEVIRRNKNGLFRRKKVSTIAKLDIDSKIRVDEIEIKLNYNNNTIWKKMNNITLLFVLSLSFICVQLCIQRYKQNKIYSYEQKIKIIKPFLSQHEYDIFNSSFAQIRNSSDYYRLMDSIKSTALKNNIKMK